MGLKEEEIRAAYNKKIEATGNSLCAFLHAVLVALAPHLAR